MSVSRGRLCRWGAGKDRDEGRRKVTYTWMRTEGKVERCLSYVITSANSDGEDGGVRGAVGRQQVEKERGEYEVGIRKEKEEEEETEGKEEEKKVDKDVEEEY